MKGGKGGKKHKTKDKRQKIKDKREEMWLKIQESRYKTFFENQPRSGDIL